MERVKEGEKYWMVFVWWSRVYIDEMTDLHCMSDDYNWNKGNYFNTKEQSEAMAEKIRKVLNGAIVIEPMTDDDEFATEVTFDGDCKIIPPKNHLIGTMITTNRGCVVEFIDKAKMTKED